MAGKKNRDFCTECRRETEYILQKKGIQKTIKEKEYHFCITTAVCAECGEEINIPGLIDKNVQEMDEQYRKAEGIVNIEDIERLMKIYKLGKAPLSLTLGFGEVTVTRYLSGQIPSKEYSDVIRQALVSPVYMKARLLENKNKIAGAAFNKAMAAVQQMEALFSVSEKLKRVIYCVFERLNEVTPLMLQKLLYFIQSVYYASYGQPMFLEDCEAWVHGPVIPGVYNLFKDFKYNPIDDARFAVLNGTEEELTGEECRVINLVVNTFGVYSGKTLERITHNETPWKEARKGYGDMIPSSEIISKESMKAYYETVNRRYGIIREEGLNRYICDMIRSENPCIGD